MPRISLYYTVIDEQGNIVRSQVTQDPNYAVGVQQRLVKDQTPDYDSTTQRIVRITPVPAGQDHVEYQIVDIVYTDAELAARALIKRNAELQESDWTQLPDVPLTVEQVSAWAVYRQALRDLPAQPGWPANINWPVQPE
jgi:hypothetical protein